MKIITFSIFAFFILFYVGCLSAKHATAPAFSNALTLGFEEDERTYEVALEILNALNIQTVNLLTNNPNKIVELEKFGLKIDKRIPLSIKSNK